MSSASPGSAPRSSSTPCSAASWRRCSVERMSNSAASAVSVSAAGSRTGAATPGPAACGGRAVEARCLLRARQGAEGADQPGPGATRRTAVARPAAVEPFSHHPRAVLVGLVRQLGVTRVAGLRERRVKAPARLLRAALPARLAENRLCRFRPAQRADPDAGRIRPESRRSAPSDRRSPAISSRLSTRAAAGLLARVGLGADVRFSARRKRNARTTDRSRDGEGLASRNGRGQSRPATLLSPGRR